MDAGTADVLDFAIRLFREPRRAREVRHQPLPAADFTFLIRCAAGDQQALHDVWVRFKLDPSQAREVVAFYLTLALFPADALPQRILGLGPASRDPGKAREHYRWLLIWLNQSSDDPLQSGYLQRIHQAWHDRHTLQSKRPAVAPALRSSRRGWWQWGRWASGTVRLLAVVVVLGAALVTVRMWRQTPQVGVTPSGQQNTRGEAASVPLPISRTRPQAGWNKGTAVPSIPVIAVAPNTSRRRDLAPGLALRQPVASMQASAAEAELRSAANVDLQPVSVSWVLPATRLRVDLSRLPHLPADLEAPLASLPTLRLSPKNLIPEGLQQRFSRSTGPLPAIHATTAVAAPLQVPLALPVTSMAMQADPVRLNADLSRLPHPPVDLRNSGSAINEWTGVTSRPADTVVPVAIPVAVLERVRLATNIEGPATLTETPHAAFNPPTILQSAKTHGVPHQVGAADGIGTLLTDFASAYEAGSAKQLMNLFNVQVRSSHGGYRRIREEYEQLFQNTLRRQLVFSVPSIALSRDGRQARVLVRYQARTAFRGVAQARQGGGVMQLSLLREHRNWHIWEIYRDRGVLVQTD